jgi:hypothetical protein
MVSELKEQATVAQKAGILADSELTHARLQVAYEALAEWEQQPLPGPTKAESPSADYLAKLKKYEAEVSRFNTLNDDEARALAALKRKMLGL